MSPDDEIAELKETLTDVLRNQVHFSKQIKILAQAVIDLQRRMSALDGQPFVEKEFFDFTDDPLMLPH